MNKTRLILIMLGLLLLAIALLMDVKSSPQTQSIPETPRAIVADIFGTRCIVVTYYKSVALDCNWKKPAKTIKF